MADRQELLAELVEGFESYLGERSAWSSTAWHEWRMQFASFGVHGDSSERLLALARLKLSRKDGEDG